MSDIRDPKKHEKLEGFEFWEKTLGRATLIVAPMVDQSELAWRMLSRRYGAELCYSPMYHATVFARDNVYRREALASCPEDHPLIIQFCANDPDVLLKAAKLAEDHCEAIDLNLGCPQSIAKRGHYGAYLQDEWDLIFQMVSRCASELKVPITCKLRVFDDVDKTIRYAQMLERAGCQLLTVHGRTREQKGIMTGLAKWGHITAVRKNVKIPVFANGNIQYKKDVIRCMKETGVQGVMSAEGNLHDPAIFTEEKHTVWDMALEYLDLVKQFPCPMGYVRGHVFKIAHHALLKHTEQRDKLANAKTTDEVKPIVLELKRLSMPDVEAYASDPAAFNSDLPLPYWICQPYVRPPPVAPGAVRKPKRPLETVLGPDNEPLSRNKIKKLQRNPNKLFAARVEFDKCSCSNIRGSRCVFKLCRKCCRANTLEKKEDCEGHKFFVKSPKPWSEFREKKSNEKTNNAEAGIGNITPGKERTDSVKQSISPSSATREDICSDHNN